MRLLKETFEFRTDTEADALKLIEEDRVNIVASADYSNNKTIDKYVKSIIDKIKLDNHIKKLEIK